MHAYSIQQAAMFVYTLLHNFRYDRRNVVFFTLKMKVIPLENPQLIKQLMYHTCSLIRIIFSSF